MSYPDDTDEDQDAEDMRAEVAALRSEVASLRQAATQGRQGPSPLPTDKQDFVDRYDPRKGTSEEEYWEAVEHLGRPQHRPEPEIDRARIIDQLTTTLSEDDFWAAASRLEVTNPS